MDKKKLVINWNYDEHDCEDCGMSWSTGCDATLDGEVIVNKKAIAHCYNGNGDVELVGVLLVALEKLGVEVVQDENDDAALDLEWYKDTCYDMDSEGNFIKPSEQNYGNSNTTTE